MPHLNSDEKIIIEILKKTKDVFEEIVSREIKNLPLEKEFQKSLFNVKDKIERVIKEVEKNFQNMDFNKFGLSSNELNLKVKGFQGAYTRWKNKRLKKNLLALLKWLNIILGSLSCLIPGCESIKEFKDCLEAHISEENGDIVIMGQD